MVDLLRDSAQLVRVVAVDQVDGDNYHAVLCWLASSIYQDWLPLNDGRWLKVPTGCKNIASSILLQDVDLTIKSKPS